MADGYRLVIRDHGGPEAIMREDARFADPGPGELLIETEAVGLNFIDVYYRIGLYPAQLPITLGSESAGTVVAVGEGVDGFARGERVGCAQGDGAYATHRVIKATQAVRLPEAVSAEMAAATMLKGFTACYLAEDIIPLEAGQIALVHSAAGGVGSLLVPWLRDKGVIVVAHAGTADKAASVDADHALSCRFQDLPQALLEATGGRRADVVYDGVGQASWTASLACLRKRGLMVSFGNASGPVPPVALTDLMRAGSLMVIRPTMADYIGTPAELAHTAERLFDRIARGVVKPVIGQRYALADAAEAHRALEARQTTGSTVLIP
ncbi:NADPH2:quinone reductase [Novosphingobium chloroacetimidivorans]|uniref:NADPH2:quinone reductase n=1 Tax=Novosphingobium chloroacetimidivorans TaxID=1428314 RepID=A0A7W7K7W4_9SPHN|nr:quinone oxidoreductase [Novosphingobium chloroacetimidivorans]MBB4857862.1 NADPH2:quinone reductase [Novosphingobium chloroacetimidivorans]